MREEECVEKLGSEGRGMMEGKGSEGRGVRGGKKN